MAQLMEHAFREGWRTPDDFVRYFPAHTIMAALKSAPDLRVSILAAATGIYEEILRRKTPALAAEDLRIALEEGTTTSQQLLGVFTPEDRVRYLDPQRIWDFLAEDQFWQADGDAGEELRRGATERMAFTLTQALQERLITLRDILDGVTYEAVADSLSPHELRSVVRFALIKGRDGIGLNEKVLLEVLPLEKLVRSVPLEHIWQEVVVRRLAIPCGFTDLPREERRSSSERRSQGEARRWSSHPSSAPGPAQASAGSLDAFSRGGPHPTDHMVTALPPAPPPDFSGATSPSAFAPREAGFGTDDEARTAVPPAVGLRESLLPPPPLSSFGGPDPVTRSVLTPPEFGSMTDGFHHAPQPPAPGSQPPSSLGRAATALGYDASPAEASERQRQRVIEHLRAIGRLPPSYASLPAAVLRSIDAMYALLPSATDDIQRKSVIRQTFANENHLRAALLGLIELMDSSVDTSDPVIQGAKIEALIKILLFEEQRRKETGRFPPGVQGSPRSPLPLAASSLPEAYAAAADGYYFPPPLTPASSRGATQPPSVLGTASGYAASAPPLPSLSAEPTTGGRRTVPPPLPPTYPRG